MQMHTDRHKHLVMNANTQACQRATNPTRIYVVVVTMLCITIIIIIIFMMKHEYKSHTAPEFKDGARNRRGNPDEIIGEERVLSEKER